jgi:ribosomal protein S18 acetylase RimI-like enzyme
MPERQNLHIRRYSQPDKQAVWRLHNVALEQIDAHGGNGPWDDDLHHIEHVYLETGGEFLVGIENARLVAMGALLPTAPGEAEIKRMRVEPDRQRQGFGRAILEALLAAARQRNLTRLHLETTTGQIAAQRLYESAGFVQTGRGRHGSFILLRYEKRLT